MNTLLALSVYPPSSATTRLRVAQFRPYFEELGVQLTLWSFLADGDMDRWYDGGPATRLWMLARNLRRAARLPRLIHEAGAILVQREVLPFGPPLIEYLCSRKRRLIWDVDDALWVPYRSHFLPWVPSRLRKSPTKYSNICRWAVEVWAATDVLKQWCADHNDSVEVMPTVVEVPECQPEREHSCVVGWIGSPATGGFIEEILPALARVRPPVDLRVVGAQVAAPPELVVGCSKWSPDAERAALAEISVGLYPIDRSSPLAEGKAGLKAILYMSQGIPCVVTPTSTNALIVRDGIEGLHAGTPEEWALQVQKLTTDEGLWKRASRASYERAHEFSTRRWGPVVAAHAKRIISAGSQARAF